MESDLPLRIVYVVPYAPTRIRTRPFHLIRALVKAGHEVTVVTSWGNPAERTAVENLVAAGVRVVAEPISRLRSAWNCLRVLPGREPLQAHYSWVPRLAARLTRLLQDAPADVLHVEHLRGVRYGLAAAEASTGVRTRRLPVVWDSVDCISSLFRRAAQESEARRVRAAARFELPRTERYEPRVAARFERVLVTSDVDRQELLALAERKPASLSPLPAEQVVVLPNGVDLEFFRPSTEPREPATLVVTGKMSYHANATAVVRFVEDVMPAVWAARPDARLWIVGKDPPPEVAALGRPWDAAASGRNGQGPAARVLVTGTVGDIRPFLTRATLAVAPIQYGVGIQNKVLEALACGTPVVATPQAVSALGLRSDEELVVAASPAEIASEIVALLQSPERCMRLGERGRSYVEQKHDWQHVAARLTGIYRDVVA